MSRQTTVGIKSQIWNIYLIIINLLVGFIIMVMWVGKLEDRIQSLEIVNEEKITKVVKKVHEEILLEYSLKTMRDEVNALHERVWNTEHQWMSVYDFLSPGGRYDWALGLTTDEIDSIMLSRDYEEWTTEKCINRLKQEGVLDDLQTN